jgi:hypothetical protein
MDDMRNNVALHAALDWFKHTHGRNADVGPDEIIATAQKFAAFLREKPSE